MNYIELYFFSYTIASAIIKTTEKVSIRQNKRKRRMIMKVLIIGGVGRGTKEGAKLKREEGGTESLILTKSENISVGRFGHP